MVSPTEIQIVSWKKSKKPEGEKGMISFFYQKSPYKKFWSYAHPFSIKTKISAPEWGACLELNTSLQRMIETVKNMRKYARNALNEIRRKHGSDGVWKHLVEGGLENIFSRNCHFCLAQLMDYRLISRDNIESMIFISKTKENSSKLLQNS
jgi:hypothetical protein